MNNPLMQYFRHAKIWVKLPTKGAYNDPDDLELSDSHEVAVRPLSSLDNIMLKTPDALMNGEALYNVIKSCVPAIKQVKNLSQPDLTAITIAIRIASHGANQELTCECPNCKHSNEISFNLNGYLDTMTDVPFPKSIDVDNNLVVHVRPFNLEQRNLELLQEFEQNKAIRIINGNDELSETEKFEAFSKHINSAAINQFETIARSILKIVIKESKTEVTDINHIREFIMGITSAQSTTIMNAIRELNEAGIDNTLHIKCEECGHDWTQRLDFDPTSFFD